MGGCLTSVSADCWRKVNADNSRPEFEYSIVEEGGQGSWVEVGPSGAQGAGRGTELGAKPPQ